MDNLYSYIINQVNVFNHTYELKKKSDEFKNIPEEFIKVIIDTFDYCELPKNINTILKKDNGDLVVLDYINYIKDLIEHCILCNKRHEEIRRKLYEKSNPLEFGEKEYWDILNWLDSIDFINNVIENSETKIIDLDDIDTNKMKLETYIPRINQQDAFDRLEKNGLETGIHCQATGCGKTYIILHYMDYCIRKYGNSCRMVLFTERVNILSDLFDFSKKRVKPNKENINYWKKIGIADLTSLDIINRVTVKDKNWVQLLNESTQPTLLVINRAFLTLRKSYKKLEPITLVLHDECHNTTSKQCYSFLIDAKSKEVPIVGFSATPLRTGKDDLSLLKEVYLKEEERGGDFPLLTNYSMIYAISNNLILPPEFYWYHIDESRIDKKDKNKICDAEIATVMDLLNSIIPKMPNKKMVAWCGRIDNAKRWRKIFTEEHKKRTHMYNFKFYLDTSQNTNEEYRSFRRLDGNAILFCANKHREGSDIRKLDACIFLDKVKNRGCIPFIQSIGRVLRLDRENSEKRNGFVIDGIYKNEGYDKAFVDKILGYYMNLENSLCKLENLRDERTRYDTYIKLKHMINFSKNKEEITIKFGNSEIKIFLNQLGWEDVIHKFDSILQNKIKLSTDNNMKHKGRLLVEHFKFNSRTNFLEEYLDIPEEVKLEYNFPDLSKEDYQDVFCNKTWFDFLGLKHNFYYDMKEARTTAPVLTYTHTEAHAICLSADRPDSRVAHLRQFAERAPATSNAKGGPPRAQSALCADSDEGPRPRE